MTNINDIIKLEKGKWPSDCDFIFTTGAKWSGSPSAIGTYVFANKDGFAPEVNSMLNISDPEKGWTLLSSKEDFIALMKSKQYWYDYDKEQVIIAPENNTTVLAFFQGEYVEAIYTAHTKSNASSDIYLCYEDDTRKPFWTDRIKPNIA